MPLTQQPSEQSRLSSEPEKRPSKREVVGVVGLILGLLGYGMYVELQQPPIVPPTAKKTASPSPKASPSPRSSGAIAASPLLTSPSPDTQVPTTEAQVEEADRLANLDGEIYQRSPKPGIYYAVNPLQNTSSREIASNDGRFCIKIVNTPVAPESGYQRIVVSSLSLRNDGIYVDATKEKLTFDRRQVEMIDSQGTWQLLEGKPDRSGLSGECLTSNSVYVREIQGNYIKGN
jgi:hypothetical protein